MTQQEQIQRFADELDTLVDRYGKEYDLPYASIIGVLAMYQSDLCDHARNLPEEEF